MPRRRSRKSRFDRLVERSALLLFAAFIGAALIVAFVDSVFDASPLFGLLLFVLLPLGLMAGVIGYKAKTRKEGKRRDLNLARQRVEAAQHIGTLLTGSGQDFEFAVSEVLRAYGYDVEQVGRAGDKGVDLIGTDANGATVIVQCKRYGPDNKVGSPVIQSFMGAVVNHDAERGIFVTTSGYTRQARGLADSSRVNIELIDGEQFTRLARDAAMRSVS